MNGKIPLVACRDCGAVFTARAVLHDFSVTEALGQAEGAEKAGRGFCALGTPCPTLVSSRVLGSGRNEVLESDLCGCSYWVFV